MMEKEIVLMFAYCSCFFTAGVLLGFMIGLCYTPRRKYPKRKKKCHG